MKAESDPIATARATLKVKGPETSPDDGRFIARYRLRGDLNRAKALVLALCYEHTVELSPDLIGDGYLSRFVVGKLSDLRQEADDLFICEILYPEAAAEGGLTTLLTLVMGNIGFFPEVELMGLELTARMRTHWRVRESERKVCGNC